MFLRTQVHSSRTLTSPAVLRGSGNCTLRLSVSRRTPVMAEAVRRTKKEAVEQAKAELVELINKTHCNPILIRLGWHDAGTYNKVTPQALIVAAHHVHKFCPCEA